jgi:7,8-dihydroneopterin aldolase/epimerase/oxygenase
MWSALAHPDLQNCRRVFLREFTVDANIGVHDSEKNGPQRVVISVDLFVPLDASQPVHDRIDEVLDYDFIRETILARIARGHINLQESLCDDVANALLLNPKVRAVRVSTEKPDVYADCVAVGIEVFRFRS